MVSKVHQLVEEFYPITVSLRRQIHQNPELGFQEFQTAALVEKTLKQYGWEVRSGVAGTGVVGLLRGSSEGPTVAIRADMDALPIQELNDVPYRSQNEGVMHACGHDVHTASLLGTAMVLSRLQSSLKGNVKLIFQPAEEGPGGALPMINEGVLENPKVDVIFGAHVWHDVPAGKIAAQSGPIMAAPDSFVITITGRGGHGAQPHLCIDAIAIAAQVINGLQHIVSRLSNPLDPVVLTIGKMVGGVRGNVIAEKVVMDGTLRTLNQATRTQCKKWIEEQVASVCEFYGAQHEVRFTDAYDITISDDEVTDFLIQSARKILGQEQVLTKLEPSMGAEDFSFFMKDIPGVYFRLGIQDEDKVHPIHHNRFDVNEEVLRVGMKVFSQAVIDILEGGAEPWRK